ncbi:MAG: ATP-binding protein [Kiritimatiellae bacterium]|jgi:predicted AAA+ superfamily ATPase|nr:ATP-binding protein [Kiritimatiellia bacterium]
MQRKAIQSLLEWKDSPDRKPLILRGARQVGKTWLLKEFGKQYFSNVVYVNFDEDDTAKQIFDNDYNIERIITALQLQCNQSINSTETLIILDEIQEAPRAITCLKYFCENAREYHVAAAGSLLGIASLEGTGFPVGKIDFLDLYPMSFSEFLNATDNKRYADLLENLDWQNITTFENKFIEYLRYYYFVGGMPEVVASFANNRDFFKVRKMQNSLLDAYIRDFSKHAPNILVPRIRLVWDSVPTQLAKENKKFIYSNLREKARASEFELAIQWLKDAGLIHTVVRVKKPRVPIMSYQDTAFKMFSLDVGLLGAQSGLDAQSIIDGNRIFTEFKGALTEQFVLQQLIAECSIEPYYWSAENSKGEIDFIFQHGTSIIPLEVKAEKNLKAKSLIVYSRKNKIPLALRTSMASFNKSIVDSSDNSEFEFQLIDLPLYAISQVINILS